VSAETQTFPTVDVLSTVTGVLIGEMAGVYGVLSWMTGESVYTHQIPRIGREAVPVMVKCHPSLQMAIDEAAQVNRDNWQEWRDRWLERYGPTLGVPKMTADQHEYREPLSELAERVPPGRIVVVEVPSKGDA